MGKMLLKGHAHPRWRPSAQEGLSAHEARGLTSGDNGGGGGHGGRGGGVLYSGSRVLRFTHGQAGDPSPTETARLLPPLLRPPLLGFRDLHLV